MVLAFSEINWIAVVVAVIVGQIILTLWFTVLFGNPWAAAYGAESKAAHAKDVPRVAYGVGLVCMVVLVIGTALIHNAIGINSATVLPAYGFLLKPDAGYIASGSQAAAILAVSTVLGALS